MDMLVEVVICFIPDVRLPATKDSIHAGTSADDALVYINWVYQNVMVSRHACG